MMRSCLCLVLALAWLQAKAAPRGPSESFITVRATTPLASEPGDNPGTFTIYRSGDTNAAVTVDFTLAGSATNGVDYASTPTSLTLAAGQFSTNIVITPVDETSAARYKKVELRLDPGHGAYRVGFLRSAVIYIAYNYTNSPPTVAIVTPTNGASFLSLPNIDLTANAFDSNGWVASVDFYANGNLVGTVTNSEFCGGPVRAPIFLTSRRFMTPIWPGARTGRFQFVWTQVPPGTYDITAVATDNAGLQTTSADVTIYVSTNLPSPQVHIINPMDGANYVENAPINIYAAAGEKEGVITAVEFLANGNELGLATNYLANEPVSQFHLRQQWLPYYFRWTNAPLGSNTITAIAIDNNGTTATSPAVNINVSTNAHWHRW